MGQVRLNIVLPPNAPSRQAKQISAEIWDASLADAPSVLLVSKLLHDVALVPGGIVEAALDLPLASPSQVLIARAHISMDGNGVVKTGDLLSTRFVEIPRDLGNETLAVPVSLVA